VLLAWTLLGAGAAFAQEPERVGLTMGYPASVGVIWPVTDRFALRPELSLSHTSADLTIAAPFGAQSSTDGSHVAFGLSALVYIQRWDALRAYVSPRFEYSRTKTQTTSTLATLASTSDVTGSDYAVGGDVSNRS
jgi:hypothetical protein